MTDKIISIEAEAAVLGSIMLDREKVFDVKSIIPDKYAFVDEQHQILYGFLVELADTECGWDFLIFRDELKKRDLLDKVGGINYLVDDIAGTVPDSANAEYYAGMVKEKYQLRRLNEYAHSVMAVVIDDSDVDTKMNIVQQDLANLVDDESTDDIVIVSETIQSVSFENTDQYLSSGFSGLDDKINGLGNGHMIIVGGRPGMGKTALMQDMVMNICCRFPAVFFSLEMTANDLMQRMVCSKAAIDLSSVLKGYANEDQKAKLQTCKDELQGHHLIIDRTSPLTMRSLRSRVLMLKRRFGIRAVFIDYLQLMKFKGSSRYEGVTEVSSDIKQLALRTEIPFIVGCQLNRAVETRTDKKPFISDLRDSGGIEQDADVILLLHRPSYYSGDEDGTAQIIIGKNRRGPCGVLDVLFYPEYCRFEEADMRGRVAF